MNNLVCILNTLLVIRLTLGHGSTPQVNVCQQCVNGIKREKATIAPIVQSISSRQQDMTLSFFQIINTMLQEAIRSGLSNQHVLVVILKRLSGIWNIAECTYQIEITQATQCQHLRTNSLVITFSKRWVNLHYVCRMSQDYIAAIDG